MSEWDKVLSSQSIVDVVAKGNTSRRFNWRCAKERERDIREGEAENRYRWTENFNAN